MIKNVNRLKRLSPFPGSLFMNHLPRDIILMEKEFLSKATNKLTFRNPSARNFFISTVALNRSRLHFLCFKIFLTVDMSGNEDFSVFHFLGKEKY